MRKRFISWGIAPWSAMLAGPIGCRHDCSRCRPVDPDGAGRCGGAGLACCTAAAGTATALPDWASVATDGDRAQTRTRAASGSTARCGAGAGRRDGQPRRGRGGGMRIAPTRSARRRRGSRSARARPTTCAIQTDPRSWCFGDNDDGQLGDGTKTAVGADPDRPGGHVGAGVRRDRHTCATQTDGTLWCWGSNRRLSSARERPRRLAPSRGKIGEESDWVQHPADGRFGNRATTPARSARDCDVVVLGREHWASSGSAGTVDERSASDAGRSRHELGRRSSRRGAHVRPRATRRCGAGATTVTARSVTAPNSSATSR